MHMGSLLSSPLPPSAAIAASPTPSSSSTLASSSVSRSSSVSSSASNSPSTSSCAASSLSPSASQSQSESPSESPCEVHHGHFGLLRSSLSGVRFPSSPPSSALLFSVSARLFARYFAYLSLSDRLSLSSANKYFFHWSLRSPLVYPFDSSPASAVHRFGVSFGPDRGRELPPPCCLRGRFLRRLQSLPFLEYRLLHLESHLARLAVWRSSSLSSVSLVACQLDPSHSLYFLFGLFLFVLYKLQLFSLLRSLLYFPSNVLSLTSESLFQRFSCSALSSSLSPSYSSSSSSSLLYLPHSFLCTALDFLSIGDSIFLCFTDITYYLLLFILLHWMWKWFTQGIPQWTGMEYLDKTKLYHRIKQEREAIQRKYDRKSEDTKKRIERVKRRIDEMQRYLGVKPPHPIVAKPVKTNN